MDTRYWGPSGWKLLHLISFAARGSKRDLANFFTSLPFVLPCKFCRFSLSGYMQELPLEASMREQGLSRWLWAIHNKVNAKLRSQNLPVAPDPHFSAVRRTYEDRLAAGCSRTKFEGWEFLFSVVENHPMSLQARGGSPMPDAPSAEELLHATPLERNRWNVMTPEERLPWVELFWTTLPKVLPYHEWQTIWMSCASDWSTRKSALQSLWAIRCRMERELQLLDKTDFYSLCKELRSHRSGCKHGTRRMRTCRRKRPSS